MEVVNIIIKVLSALLLAVIWSAYLRKVDIFYPEKWGWVILSFTLGCLTVIPVFAFDLPDLTGSNEKTFWNMLVFYVWNVGFMEELSKFSAFLILYSLFRKRIFAEIPNFIIHGSIVALGFATIENFAYFQNYGVDLVYMRGMMSTFTHMVGTSIIAAFFYFGIKKGWIWIFPYTILGLIIASIEHGLYNTFLSYHFTGNEKIFKWLSSIHLYKVGNVILYLSAIAIYMVGIEIYCKLLNNFSNLSPHFDPKKFIDRRLLTRMLFVSFFIAGGIQVFGLLQRYGIDGIMGNVIFLMMEMIFTVVLVTRITRFTFIQNKWYPIYPVLPFVYKTIQIYNPHEKKKESFSYLTIRGDEFNEYPYTKNLGFSVHLIPLLPQKSLIGQSFKAQMVEKVFLGNEILYRMELIDTEFTFEGYHSTEFILKPKVLGTTNIENQPIAGVMLIPSAITPNNIMSKDLRFVEWVILESIDAPKRKKRNFFREFFI